MKTPTPEIRQALYRRLLCALPIQEITETDVAWPNVAFDPQVNRMYLAPFCLFGESEMAALSDTGFEKIQGIFQITVYGILHTGEARLERIAADLTNLFRTGSRIAVPSLPSLSITKAYRSSLTTETGGEMPRPSIVVSAHWQHYVPRGE